MKPRETWRRVHATKRRVNGLMLPCLQVKARGSRGVHHGKDEKIAGLGIGSVNEQQKAMGVTMSC